MKQSDATKIRNITLAGHLGSGKTALAEALLYKAGATDRLGKCADGNTVSDYDPEEIKRQISINTTLSSFSSGENRINLLDTPGLFDFAGGMLEGIQAADTVMLTVSAKSGVKVGTRKAYDAAAKLGRSKMFVITKIDDPNANFYNTLTQLKTVFGPTVCPVVVPVIQNSQIISYVNLIEMKAYKYDDKGNAVETDMPTPEVSEKMEYRLEGLISAISEAVAETDEALMEKFFEGEAFTQKELIDGIHNGMNKGIITPVVCVSSTTLAGIDMLLKEIDLLLPAPQEVDAPIGVDQKEDPIAVACDPAAPLVAYVFRTVADPFVGKMSFIRVYAGKLSADANVLNATTGATEKIGKLYVLLGKKQEEVASAAAGDIVVAAKISAGTSDTLCAPERVLRFAPIQYPKPCYSLCVKAKSQGDETKISAGIARLLEEDQTLSYQQDAFTKEQILSGLGSMHLEVTAAKLKNKFGVDVQLEVPRIAYRETIRKKVKVEGKHKKQSGGHGQYGHVWIEFEPCMGDDLVFEERVFGGAVPRNFFPAVEKGLQECVRKGVLAGCPVVGLKAILVDGSYHPVDSSEMAFKMAASIAYKEGLPQADPVMLEPIGSLNVTVPDENTGDVMGELNKRRGRVLGMEPVAPGMTLIQAEVPMREMQDFALYLRQSTRGMGEFSFTFLRYEQLPANLLSTVIASVNQQNG
ncbi:elongation factor G [Ruminococcus champanellensis]|uniref:Translation elongation factor 2 (EF-2/EF-G) n=2 Tax=Ruminococcus TaxID=1263 RepID=D4LEY4_RUMC1|nr:elongation factor G [Ruminococcus champanellensis]CBL18179.1 translation elongation factor 2 (EF-2/EF-G) [Ruminococcus champanellensis 18P13 = JCM 17042]